MKKVAGWHLLVGSRIFQSSLAVMFFVSGLTGVTAAFADDDSDGFSPGNLLVSRAVYDNNSKNVEAGMTLLPPNCAAPACVTATDNGTYPNVWNNSLVDSLPDRWSTRLKCPAATSTGSLRTGIR
jgi:hypothetical protein